MKLYFLTFYFQTQGLHLSLSDLRSNARTVTETLCLSVCLPNLVSLVLNTFVLPLRFPPLQLRVVGVLALGP